MHPRALLPCTAASRLAGPLHAPVTGEAPSQAELCAAAAVHGAVWLTGGEPTLRADLPSLIAALHAQGTRVGLHTDALALTNAGAWRALQGIDKVRIDLHAARPDAHDWLVGIPGAARRARRSIRAALTAGLPTEVRVLLTRPTAPHLPETLALLRHMGISQVQLAFPTAAMMPASSAVAVLPRIGLLEPILQDAVEIATANGQRVRLVGLPPCAAPALGTPHFAPPSSRLNPGRLRWRATPPPTTGCPGCTCAGAPQPYVQLFGRAEFESERPGAAGIPSARPLPNPPPAPPPRQGRAPGTRLRITRPLAYPENLGGDPAPGRPAPAQPDTARVAFKGTSRTIRSQLVALAQSGATQLVIYDDSGPCSLSHPQAMSLLRDCLRLGFRAVHLHGDPSPFQGLADRELVGLRGLTSARHGGEQAAPTLERLSRIAGVHIQRDD